tara:strand:- start:745 stop:936 length:192 start_codon:yes stop_codon:yes gene_type:complete
MLAIRKQTSEDGNEGRFSITLLHIFQIAVTYHSLRGRHLDLTLGVGPIDINIGTTVWNGVFRR